MDITQLIAALKLLKSVFRTYKKNLSKKKYKELISSAVTELLQEHPDINAAEAALLAAEATGINPTTKLLRTKEMLGKVKSYGRGTKKAARRKVVKKKVTKKRAIKKKTMKKKAVVKTAKKRR